MKIRTVLTIAMLSVAVLAYRVSRRRPPEGAVETAHRTGAGESRPREGSRRSVPAAGRFVRLAPVGPVELGPDAWAEEVAREQVEVTASVRASAEKLAAHFARDALDPRWASQTERSLADRLGPGAPTATLVSAQCRSTMCRLVIDHASLDEQAQLAGRLRAAGVLPVAAYFVYEEDAVPPRTRVYLPRGEKENQELVGAL